MATEQSVVLLYITCTEFGGIANGGCLEDVGEWGDDIKFDKPENVWEYHTGTPKCPYSVWFSTSTRLYFKYYHVWDRTKFGASD